MEGRANAGRAGRGGGAENGGEGECGIVGLGRRVRQIGMGVEQAEQGVGEQGDAGPVWLGPVWLGPLRFGEGLFERGLERRGEPGPADGDGCGNRRRQQRDRLGQNAPRHRAGPAAVAQIGLGHGGEAGGGVLAHAGFRVAIATTRGRRIVGAEHGFVERVHGLGEDGGEEAGLVRIGAAQRGLAAAHLPGQAGERDGGDAAAGEEIERGGAHLPLPLAPGGERVGGAGGLPVRALLGLGEVEALAVARDEGEVAGPLGLAARNGGGAVGARGGELENGVELGGGHR